MLTFGIISALLIAGTHANHCFLDAKAVCDRYPTKTANDLLLSCNAKFGSIEELKAFIQEYANFQVEKSFEYLLYSIHFGNYEVNRPGFKALFRHLSDKAWNTGINIMQFLAARGQRMNFHQHFVAHELSKLSMDSLNEFVGLARALDMEKRFVQEAFVIHEEALVDGQRDPSVAHYLEEIIEKQTETIRLLSGYVNDVKKIISEGNVTLPMTLYDDYLVSQFK